MVGDLPRGIEDSAEDFFDEDSILLTVGGSWEIT
jgi:hypothetical protein